MKKINNDLNIEELNVLYHQLKTRLTLLEQRVQTMEWKFLEEKDAIHKED